MTTEAAAALRRACPQNRGTDPASGEGSPQRSILILEESLAAAELPTKAAILENSTLGVGAARTWYFAPGALVRV